jgi:2-iminobutanoate/2-iminopropanoate deaminase
VPASSRQILNSPDAAAAVGPYSHAARVSGELLFISGQIPLDPVTSEIVGETPAEQARRCLENLEIIAAAGGTSLSQAVKVTIYLIDMAAFAEVNEVYAEFFPSDPPARVTVAVAGLPKGSLVEIDAVVAVGA